MRVIDKKGRVFGLVNIIDLLVIIFIIALVLVGVKRFKSVPTVSADNAKPGIVEFEITDVRIQTVDGIKENDPIYEYDKGKLLGTIVSKEVEPYKKEMEYKDGFVLAEVPEKYMVKLKVKAQISESNDFYVVGGEQLRIGTQVRIKNKNIATFANCMGVSVDK